MYEIKTRVGYSKLNTKGQLSFRALLDEYQDCATFHSEDVLCPLDEMIRRQNAWFLVSYQIKNFRMPRHGEEISIRTFPVKIKGMIGIRTFDMVDADGNILSMAYSEWVFMDLKKMRPARVRDDIINAYTPDDVDVSMWGARKIALPAERKKVGEILVEKTYLDTNGHVNNAYYPDIAANAVDGADYSDIRVEFKNSAVLGDKIVITKVVEEDRVVVVLEDTNGSIFSIVEFSGVKNVK